MDVKQFHSITQEQAFDIVVVGGGNAALCAAIAARERGASVLLLERAPEYMRAGNTRHTRNIRCVRVADGCGSCGVYSEDEFLEDLMQVTGSPPNLDLARRTIRESRWTPTMDERTRHQLAGAAGRHPKPWPHESLVPWRR